MTIRSVKSGSASSIIWIARCFAQGYIVVIPTILSPPGSISFDPLDLYSSQIEALAAQLIEAGVATPGGIGFYGHSYGGYTALCVASRTKLISAVVASAPFPILRATAA
ncbi:MAG: alpha/beta fold hydrolase [Rhizomicrobium sp.]